MSREWKPGDVAMRSRKGEEYIAIVESNCGHHLHDDGPHWHYPHMRFVGWDPLNVVDKMDVTFRPLVVIDPEDREQVERLAGFVFNNDGPFAVDALQAHLRAFANPTPAIEEPPGWLSVVIDHADVEWYRWSVRPKDAHQAWISVMDEGRCYPTGWDSLNAVRVLSEGVAS